MRSGGARRTDGHGARVADALFELAEQARHCEQREAREMAELEVVVDGKQGALGDAMPDRCLVIVRYAGNE